MESQTERTMATTTKTDDEITINVPPGVLILIGILVVIALLMSSVADNEYLKAVQKVCADRNSSFTSREGNFIHCQRGTEQIDVRVKPIYSK